MGIAAALLLLILSAMLFGGGAQNATKHGHDNIKGEAQEATEPASNPGVLHRHVACTCALMHARAFPIFYLRRPAFDTVPRTADMSVTTTQKNSTFQSTPLQDVKKLTDVPGVGPKSAEKLKEANIDSAVKLMGNYLVCSCSVHASGTLTGDEMLVC